MNGNSKDQFTELLFENRNKNYGAYVIRTGYDKRLKLALMITLSFMALAVITPGIFSGIKPKLVINTKPDNKVRIVEMKLNPDVKEKKADSPKILSKAQPKGNTLAITPVDSSKTADADTVKSDSFVKNGDPKGTDTTGHVPLFSGGGNGTDTIRVRKPKEILSVAEINPEFPGGLQQLYEFFRKNIKYPRIAVENEITGKVYLSFVVDEDGTIKDIKNLNAIGGGCELEAVRVAGLMPKWKPGMMGSEPVPVRYSIPVKFELK